MPDLFSDPQQEKEKQRTPERASSASVSWICGELSRLERELELFSRAVRGVVFWPLMRIDAYYHLATYLKVFQEPHPIHRDLKSLLQRAWRRIYSAVFYNPFFARKSRYAVFLHARKINGREIYSDQLIRELEAESPLLIDFPTVNRGYQEHDYGRCSRYDFCRLVARILARVWPANCSQDERAFLEVLFLRFEGAFGTQAVSMRQIARAISSFKIEAALYRLLFKMKGVKDVFVVVGYSDREIIHGAKLAGCRVHEFQHGTITPFHLGYSFPRSETVPYTPDTVLTFGDFWHRSTELGATTRGVTIGSANIQNYRNRTKAQDQVIVLSQGVIGRRLFSTTRNLAELRPDLRFLFNPHPSETPEDYGCRPEEPLPDNLTIRSSATPFFEQLAESSYQIGVFSTALYEGMAFGNRTLLIDLPGIEYMQPVIDAGDAVVCRDAAEAAKLLSSAPMASRTDDYYAPPVSSILQALDDRSTP